MPYSLKYPRRRFIRSIFRGMARLLIPLLSRTRITNRKGFPKRGPLIVVGNHTGAIETVLMATYAPQAMEFMGAAEMPWNDWMGTIIDMYAIIPVHRGYTSKTTMEMGVDVLRQGGMLGVFPEGGFWEPGRQRAQSGVAWLSYMSGAPILPIGFGDTRGKMMEAFRLKRPSFEMNVGAVLPAVKLEKGANKKDALQEAADAIMDAVWVLVPEEERLRKELRPEDEVFTFRIAFFDAQGKPVPIPAGKEIADGSWLSRFAHRPNLIDSIRDYIFPEIQVFKELERQPSAAEFLHPVQKMLDYVDKENPQYFNYRYGYEGGGAFQQAFTQLRDLLQWAQVDGLSLQAEVRYEYTDPRTHERVIRTKPEESEQW